jgi:hypothetical protein
MRHGIYTTIIVAAISTGFLGGCSRARMKVTASPQDVDPGGIVRVSGPLERISSERAQLRYRFDAAAGSFSPGYAESTPATLWTAPSEPGTYSLSVVVLDGESTIARGQALVTVRSGARRKLNVEYEAPPEVTLGGAFSERKTIIDELWRENAHTPDTCTRIVCEALTGSCRITWASPPGNFGAFPGHDLSWATKLTFWARGHYGVEEIWASAGADPVGQFPSTLRLTPDPKSGRGMLKLTGDWTQYTIPLAGNLTNLPVLFDVLIPPAGGAPVIIYVDDINYEQ